METKLPYDADLARCPIDPVTLNCFLDGELSSDENAAVKAHLAACPSCRKEYESLQKAVLLTRALTAEAPSSIRENVAAAISRESAVPATPAPSLSKIRRIRMVMGTAAAALVLVAGLTVLWPRLQLMQENLGYAEDEVLSGPLRNDGDMNTPAPSDPTSDEEADAPGFSPETDAAPKDNVTALSTTGSVLPAPEIITPPTETDAPCAEPEDVLPEAPAPDVNTEEVENPSSSEIDSSNSHLYYYFGGEYYYWPDELLSPTLPENIMREFAKELVQLAPLAGDDQALAEALAYLASHP